MGLGGSCAGGGSEGVCGCTGGGGGSGGGGDGAVAALYSLFGTRCVGN